MFNLWSLLEGEIVVSPREWDDPKPTYKKKLNVFHFIERVPCPYCPTDAPTYPTNLSLARHVLQKHNWNPNPPKEPAS